MGASEHRQQNRNEPGSDRRRGGGPVVPPEPSSWRNIRRKVVNDAAYIRLRSELTAAIPEFELLVERTAAEGESWALRGREILQMAVDALEAGAIDAAWRHLHTAKRLEIYGLERLGDRGLVDDAVADGSEDGGSESGEVPRAGVDGGPADHRSELQVRADVVYEEARDALDGWRRRAVLDLLGDGTGYCKAGVTGPELRAATRILHEHYEGIYLVRSEQQRQFNHLVVMGVLSGLSLFALAVVDWLLRDSEGSLLSLLSSFLETPFGGGAPEITAPGFALFVTLAGVMGASLFGMRSLRKRPLPTNVPQQINQVTVTGARAVIGAISALLFYFALQAPMLWGGPNLLEPSSAGPAMVVVGFAAGYNERMAPAVVARVASITDTEPPDVDERDLGGDEDFEPGTSGETDEPDARG